MISLQPWRRAASLEAIDPAALKRSGVRLVLLDRDNTCVPRGKAEPPSEVVSWCARAHQLGLALGLVSNNWSSAKLQSTAATLGCPVVRFALKPLPFGLWRAMEQAGVPKEQTVLVGDQLFTDVLGGWFAGVRVVMVEPQSASDLPHTLLLRRFEKYFLTDLSRPEAWQDGDDGCSPHSGVDSKR